MSYYNVLYINIYRDIQQLLNIFWKFIQGRGFSKYMNMNPDILISIIKNFFANSMANHLEYKHRNILSKLWNQTQFSIWSSLAKNQANILYQSIDKVVMDCRQFQNKMNTNFSNIQQKQLKLPIFHVIKEEIKNCKARMETMLNQEAQTVGKLIQLLADFRKTLQYGELNATKQYTQAIGEALSFNHYKLSQKKLFEVHEHYIGMDIDRKIALINSHNLHPFQKWYIDFSIRSEQFFRKALIFENYQNYQNQVKNCFSGKKNQQEIFANPKPKDDDSMDQQSQDDIIKQIFRQIEGSR